MFFSLYTADGSIKISCVASAADEMLGEVSTASSSIPEEMDIGIELFLAADHGLQNYDYYKACSILSFFCSNVNDQKF